MMRDIDELLPQVLPYAPRCPEPTAIRFLREAAREVCKVSLLWRESDSFPVAAPDCEGVCTISDAAIERIESAFLDDRQLDPVTLPYLDSIEPGWRNAEDAGTPADFITQLGPNTVTIYPRATGTLKIGLVLVPSMTALMLPDFLLDQYGIEIGKGAAGRVLALPNPDNPEMVNPSLASALLGEFSAFLDRLRTGASRGQQHARRRTRPARGFM